MDVYEDLEEGVKAQGVRVAERLELIRILRQLEGALDLAGMVDSHDRSIEEAAKKVWQVLR